MGRPVRRSLPPLHRRGMYQYDTRADTFGAVEKVLALHKSNRLRQQIMVSIILMGKRVNRSNMIRFRADMLVRPYGWFTNIHGASGCDHPVRLRLPPLHRR